jgi:glycosyltransferase involved in cell wall biosynthesis
MRIVQLVTQMEAGGAQRVAILLTEALRTRGHEVEVWFLYVKRPIYQNFPGVRVLLEHKPSGLDYLKIAIKLAQLLCSHQPDVLITHTYYANVLGQFVAKLCGVSMRIAVQHNPLFTYPKIAAWIDGLLGTMNFYSANVAVSQAVLESATKYLIPYKKKLTRIYNGLPSLKIENSPAEIRARWALPEKAPLLLNVGRLAQQKNQAVLLKALVLLPETHLLFVGEGELKTFLQKQVVELGLGARVHFLGEMESQDVLRLLCVSNVFVFPSFYEAMPMAVIEALSLGLPVVASDIPALREVLGDAGIFVAAENAEEIAIAVRQVLNSSELAGLMRKRSLERANLFSLQKMVDSYEAFFA